MARVLFISAVSAVGGGSREATFGGVAGARFGRFLANNVGGLAAGVGRNGRFPKDPCAHFDALVKTIGEFLESADSQRIVFFIDDFDLLIGGIEQRGLDWLCSLAARYGDNLAFVIGSSDPLAVLTDRGGE